jgi:hypothetical protein
MVFEILVIVALSAWYDPTDLLWSSFLIRHSILLGVGSALALKIFLFLSSGEYFTLSVEYIRLSRRITREQYRWLLVVHSCFCISVAIVTIILLVLGWTNFIDGSLRLSAWVSRISS